MTTVILVYTDDRRSNGNNIVWHSSMINDSLDSHQRLSQLKHRQNELKLELTMTKTSLQMDKKKSSIEQKDCKLSRQCLGRVSCSCQQ
jgi:hypothetical protein